MDGQQLLSGLIETYRILNTNLRRVDEDRLRAARGGNGTVRDVVRTLRDDELLFSQELKQRVSGVPMADPKIGGEKPTIGTETDQDTTAMMIAQFGTARESTLAMLRSLPDAEWDAATNGTSIRGLVTELLNNDRRQLDRINQLLAA